jgi:hypothetical protein
MAGETVGYTVKYRKPARFASRENEAEWLVGSMEELGFSEPRRRIVWPGSGMRATHHSDRWECVEMESAGGGGIVLLPTNRHLGLASGSL